MKIIQYFVEDNQKYLQLAKLVEEVNKKYSELHGYNYQMCYLNKDDITKIYSSCTWDDIIDYKIKFILDKLLQCEEDIVIIDADAAVSNPNITMEMFMDNKHDLFLSRGNGKWYQINTTKHLIQILTQFMLNEQIFCYYMDDLVKYNQQLFSCGQMLSYSNLMFNEGFIIIKNNPFMRQFFTECLKNQHILRQIKKTTLTNDGRSMSFTLQYQKYKDCYTIMNQNAQGGYINSYGTRYNEATTFILHNFGKGYTIDEKINGIKNLKTNMYWKYIFK